MTVTAVRARAMTRAMTRVLSKGWSDMRDLTLRGRNFMVPIPRFATWDDRNLWLAEQCRKHQAGRFARAQRKYRATPGA